MLSATPPARPFRTQADEPLYWPDTGRPNPWADLTRSADTILGRPLSDYFGWPVAHRSAAGDVWQTRPDAYAVRAANGTTFEFRSLASAVSFVG